MNYRHAYHAGNFADVVKHAVLAAIIVRLKRKDSAFRVVDTHAGIGIYDLTGDAATRTGEWRAGIGRLVGPDAIAIPDDIAAELAPYLDVVRALNPAGALTRYPGSGRIARTLMRQQDRLVVNELHPQDAAALRRAFLRDRQTKVMEIDGWTALKSLLPPPERRGVVLIDPPFEQPDEFASIEAGLAEALRRFATGVYLVWYPLKDPDSADRFIDRVAAADDRETLSIRVFLDQSEDAMGRMRSCGLLIKSPPYQLEAALKRVLPWLARVLSSDGTGKARVEHVPVVRR